MTARPRPESLGAFLSAMLGAVPSDGCLVHAAGKVPPPTGVAQGKWIPRPGSSVEDISSFLSAQADCGELYASFAIFDRGTKPTRRAVAACFWLSVDIDDKVMPGATPADRHTQAQVLAHAVPVPAVVVDSGRGYQLHLRLPEGERVQDFEDREDGQRQVMLWGRALRLYLEQHAARTFGTGVGLDHCHGPERMWRVPRSWNAKAPDSGRVLTADRSGWRAVTLTTPATPEAIADVPEAKLEFLQPLLDAASYEAEGEVDFRVPKARAATAAVSMFELGMLPEHIRRKWPHLQKPGKSESDADYHLGCVLRDRGYSAAVLADGIRQRREALPSLEDRKKGRRPDYLERTLRKVYGAATSGPVEPVRSRTPFLMLPREGLRASMRREPDLRLLIHLHMEANRAAMKGRPRVVKTTWEALAEACAYKAGTGGRRHTSSIQVIRRAVHRLAAANVVRIASSNERQSQGQKFRALFVEVLDPRDLAPGPSAESTPRGDGPGPHASGA